MIFSLLEFDTLDLMSSSLQPSIPLECSPLNVWLSCISCPGSSALLLSNSDSTHICYYSSRISHQLFWIRRPARSYRLCLLCLFIGLWDHHLVLGYFLGWPLCYCVRWCCPWISWSCPSYQSYSSSWIFDMKSPSRQVTHSEIQSRNLFLRSWRSFVSGSFLLRLAGEKSSIWCWNSSYSSGVCLLRSAHHSILGCWQFSVALNYQSLQTRWTKESAALASSQVAMKHWNSFQKIACSLMYDMIKTTPSSSSNKQTNSCLHLSIFSTVIS